MKTQCGRTTYRKVVPNVTNDSELLLSAEALTEWCLISFLCMQLLVGNPYWI